MKLKEIGLQFSQIKSKKLNKYSLQINVYSIGCCAKQIKTKVYEFIIHYHNVTVIYTVSKTERIIQNKPRKVYKTIIRLYIFF